MRFGLGLEMRFGLRAREVAVITLLTLLVGATFTLIHLSQLSRVVIEEAVRQGGLIGKQIYAQSSRALSRAHGGNPSAILRKDRELRSLVDASVGYAPHLVYALIADREGRAVLHSEPEKEDSASPARPPLQELLSLDPARRFHALYQEGKIYEAALSMSLNGQPFGSIRLGVAPSLLRSELNAALKHSLAVAGVALPVAWLVALGLASLTLKPIRRLTREMDRLRRGEFEMSGDLGRDGEFAELASQLQLLGQQIRSDRLKMMSEKAQLEQVAEHLEDGILFLSHDRRILSFNTATEALVGRSLGKAVGEPLKDLLEPAHPLRRLLEQAFQQHAGFRNVAITLPTEGGVRELLASVFVVRDARRAIGAMILLRDLESIKTLRSVVSYSARLTALGRLTSGVAHEIRNPLNAMMIHLELLKEQMKEQMDVASDDVQQTLDVIASEIRRLDRALQGFLKFIRPQEPVLKPVDVNALLTNVAALLEAEWQREGIRFALRLDPALPHIAADEELLRQAFLNILLNACQAMPAGGTVSIETEREDWQFVRVSITDEGVGIPPEDLDRVFSLYYTTKPDGSGIGLAIVFRIVQLHDGIVDVSSELGRGTTVRVRLPMR